MQRVKLLIFIFTLIFFNTLAAQKIEVVSPNGGELWDPGATPQFIWNSENISNVKIEISYNAGNSWNTVAGFWPAGFRYDWRVPDSVSNECLVRISDVSDSTLFDLSDSTFSIVDDLPTVKIAILGSSTAAGVGPSNSDSAWVSRYRSYLQQSYSGSEVQNFAVGGYTTYHIMPDGYVPPEDRPSPSTGHNITKAISINPAAIIINLPSNDATNGYTIKEQLSNYDSVLAHASAMNIAVWVATTQPRNLDSTKRANLMEMRDSTYTRFGANAIDFWSVLANEDGTINPPYNSGDGVHLNNSGHYILFSRVRDKNIQNQILVNSIEKIVVLEPSGFLLKQNYPNPFNPETAIEFSTEKKSAIRIAVYDILGRRVAIVADRTFYPGSYKVKWNASGMTSGIYFYTLERAGLTKTKRMLLLK